MKFRIFLVSLFVTSYVYLLFFYFTHSNVVLVQKETCSTNSAQTSTEKVVRIIDGDTFEINGGIKVRLIGIDTPEMKNQNKTIDCFAQESKRKLETMIGGKEVVLVKDISETDKYGRLLRYVYLGNEMVNDTLVKEGYARISTFPPDVKFKDQFLADERQAREANFGLWSACK